MKAYNSYINIRANPFLKVIGDSNNICVYYIVSPLDGDKGLLQFVFVIESLIQEIRSKTLMIQ